MTYTTDRRYLLRDGQTIATFSQSADARMFAEAGNLLEHIRAGNCACPDLAARLHGEIMNLPLKGVHGQINGAYYLGFRDARHAAAELVLERLGSNAAVPVALDRDIACVGCGAEKSHSSFVCCGECWRRLPRWMKDQFMTDHRYAPGRGPSVWQDRMSLLLSWLNEASAAAVCEEGR